MATALPTQFMNDTGFLQRGPRGGETCGAAGKGRVRLARCARLHHQPGLRLLHACKLLARRPRSTLPRSSRSGPAPRQTPSPAVPPPSPAPSLPPPPSRSPPSRPRHLKNMTLDTTTATRFMVLPTLKVTGEMPWSSTM